ncbi:MAG: Crp/Fnr family transcriptional regulator [Proteobacteria bacterium]|nr:Crp/Fnr family transcriptional regulator [Pseudomonadota bacterium]
MRIAYRQHCQSVLLRSQWFAGLPEALQNMILELSMLRLVEEGHVLIAEDSLPTSFFLLLEGQVAITRRIGSQNEFFYHLGGPGFCFGEIGLLNGKETVITATARTPVRTLILPLTNFRSIIESNPEYYEHFSRLMEMRYAILMRNLAQSRGLSLEEYLRVRLADISDMIHAEGGENETVELALTQYDLAQMIGASRQTVNAILHKLVKDELVELSFRKIRILDPDRLRSDRRKAI